MLLPLHTLIFIFLQEISRLQEENDKLKARLRSLESQVWLRLLKHTASSIPCSSLPDWFLQAMSALDEKSRAERALKDLQKVQGEDMVRPEFAHVSSNWWVTMKELTFYWVCFLFQLPAKDQEISSLEDTVAALKEDYERCLSASAASQKDLQENLVSSKHQLLRVQEQLLLAEKVRLVSLPPPIGCIQGAASLTLSYVCICRSWRRSSSRLQPTATWRRSWPRRTSRLKNWGNSCRGSFTSVSSSPVLRLLNREICLAFRYEPDEWAGTKDGKINRCPDVWTRRRARTDNDLHTRRCSRCLDSHTVAVTLLLLFYAKKMSRSCLKRPCPLVWLILVHKDLQSNRLGLIFSFLALFSSISVWRF